MEVDAATQRGGALMADGQVLYGSHSGPGPPFCRRAHRVAGLASCLALGGIFLSESFVVAILRWRFGTCRPAPAWGVRAQATSACHPGMRD